MEREKKNRWLDWGMFAFLFAIATAITFILFYRQTLGSPEAFHSDMKAYILEMQGLDSGYSFPYPIFFKMGAFYHLFVNPQLAVALATVTMNSLGILVMKLAFNHCVLPELERSLPDRKWLAYLLVNLVTVSLFFCSMLFPPHGIYLPGIKYNYLGVFTSNPFHNATYMAARPFAILAFLWYVKLLPVYEQGVKEIGVKDYVLFSLFLLLATMTKPSFTIVLVGAAGLIMVWRMLLSKFKNFWQTIQLGCCFIPTFLDLLYQFKGVFVPAEGEEGGMGFCFGRIWGLYCDNIPLAICLAVGFPLLVLILNFRELKTNTLYRFSWQIYGMGFAMAFLLYEKGFREPDFNFSWGYMYGIFFAFVGALMVLFQATARKEKPLLLALQWLAYLAHVVCGLYYFYGIFCGGMYY